MKILFFFIVAGFLAVAFVLLFGVSVLRMFLGALFGTRPGPRNASSNQQKTKQTAKQPTPSPVKKIFTREEGEYVDFEEIKD